MYFKGENMKNLKVAGLTCGAILFLSAAVSATEVPQPQNENGIITAEEWSAIYPEIYESLRMNADNNYRVDYLKQDSYLSNVYEGYGFAKDYTSAVGHDYCLDDVKNTERPHPTANCLTCKTPDFTKLVNDMGVEAYLYDFDETWAQMNENVSCYNCHENQEANEDGNLVVTHSYVTKALGDEMAQMDPATLACGQCHIEYYFQPDTKETSMPYNSVAAMAPEAILAYYDEIGFSDWTQESTGTSMLKAQHPEMETFLGEGSIHAKIGLNCASCHMGTAVSEEGNTYVSHRFQSPLDSPELLETCAVCHKDTDMTKKVHDLQDEITGRETEVGEKLSALKDALAGAVADGSRSEEELNELRSLYRSAQWYWDFCYVENSEGAHNSALARKCLDTSESLIDDAMGKLGA